MKNNKNYCKFVSQVKSSQVKSSQVKSSQVKSSAKIVSLINNSFKTFLIALFILLFSISCKPKQNPTPKYSELVGTWKSTYDGYEFILNIDSEGNLIFNCGLGNNRGRIWHHNFSGKLAETFEYPYTIELTFTASSLSSTSCRGYELSWFNKSISVLMQKSKTGKFTFHDASTLTASVIMLGDNAASGGFVYWYDDYNRGGVQTLNFTKQ